MTKAGLGETRVEIQLPRPGQWLAGLCSRVSNPAGKLPSLPAARWARVNSYTLKYAECKHPGCPHLSPSTLQLPRCHHTSLVPTNGKCHHPLDQWARVTRLSANGKCRSVAMSPSCGPMGGRSIPGAAHTTSQHQTWRNTETSRQTGSARPELN